MMISKRIRLPSIAVLVLSGIVSPGLAQTVQSNLVTQRLALSSPGPSQTLTRAGHRISPRRVDLYDGIWSVVIQTTRGSCPAAVRAGIRISGGRLLADDQSYQVDGRVTPGGRIRVTVSAGGQGAAGSGRLSSRLGGGQWRTWSGECSGQWTVERRD
jgi:hypothetical protein